MATTPDLDAPHQPDSAAVAMFGRDLLLLCAINAGVLVGLIAIHLVFAGVAGTPAFVSIAMISARLVLLAGEAWLIRRALERRCHVSLNRFHKATVVIGLAFAFALSIAAGLHDSHYHVLMMIPILSTAMCSGLWASLSVALVASLLSFSQIAIDFRRHPPGDAEEFFEACTMALVYIVVAGVTWMLIRRLRSDRQSLAESLAALRAAHDRLIEQEKLAAVGRLAGSIAHEIRNPVAMIASSLQMHERNGRSAEAQAEMLSIARGESARLERLTSDFLTYARTQPAKRVSTPLLSQLEYMASVVRPRAEERSVTVTLDCEPHLRAAIDPHQFQQAILNLLLNALDAAPAGSTITLRCRADADGVVLSITNPGSPIAHEHVQRIFEPFYTTKPRGTGLGLAIARKIAQAHGGDLILAENGPAAVRFDFRIGAEVSESAATPT